MCCVLFFLSTSELLTSSPNPCPRPVNSCSWYFRSAGGHDPSIVLGCLTRSERLNDLHKRFFQWSYFFFSLSSISLSSLSFIFNVVKSRTKSVSYTEALTARYTGTSCVSQEVRHTEQTPVWRGFVHEVGP